MNKDVILSKTHQGQITRGKTAINRLRRVDQFILQYDPMLIHRRDKAGIKSMYIDHGYGWSPVTTLESSRQFHQINPNLKIVGVEISPERVETGTPYLSSTLDFRLGGFDIPYQSTENARLIRSFNVLRQYEEDEFISHLKTLTQGLENGGLLIEGTSNPTGRFWVANLIRKQKDLLKYEGLVFSTNFHDGFIPQDFQPFLPKNLIHHMISGHPIFEFIQDWSKAAQNKIHIRERSYTQWYASCVEEVARMGYQVETRRSFTRRGFCVYHWNNIELEESLNI
jgi:hypothetical protein